MSIVIDGIKYYANPNGSSNGTYPPRIRAYSSNVDDYIGSTDTVCVCGDDNAPPIIGRIIEIVTERPTMLNRISDEPVPLHPSLHLHDVDLQSTHNNNDSTFCLIQLAIGRGLSTSIDGNVRWPILDDESMLACNGVEEVAHTNLSVWVHMNQISTLVAIVHTEDCKNHTWGPMRGRANTYHTSSTAIFNNGDDNRTHTHTLTQVRYGDYCAFGSNNNSRVVSATQQKMEASAILCRLGRKCLTGAGQIGGTKTITQQMPSSTWNQLERQLRNDLSVSTATHAHRRTLLHCDLSLESKILPNQRTTLTATQSSQHDALTRVTDCSFGKGVRKRPPSKKDIAQGATSKKLTLQLGDTVNIVDVSLEGESEHHRDHWFPDDVNAHRLGYYKQDRNYTKVRYDQRTNEFSLTFKAYAIKVGQCDAEPVLNYLHQNQIEWNSNVNHEHPELRMGRGIAYNGTLYIINRVNTIEGTVLLDYDDVDDEDDEEVQRSVTISISQAELCEMF